MALPVEPRRGEAAVASVLLLIGGFFVWQSLKLPMGSVGLPGPGFFPFVLGLALATQAIGLIVGSLAAPRGELATALGHRDVLLTFGALLLVPLLFERAGALLTLGLFAAAVAVIVGRILWWRAALGAALGMAATWYFFKVLLGVQLPAGIF